MLQHCGYPTLMRINEKAVENVIVIHSLFKTFSTGYQR